jgi:hypothetical protein
MTEPRSAIDDAVLAAMVLAVKSTFVKLMGAKEAQRIFKMKTARDRQSYRLTMARLLRKAIHSGKYPIDAGALRIIGIGAPDDVPDAAPVRAIELDEENRLFGVRFDVEDDSGPDDEVLVTVEMDNDGPRS